MTGEGKAVLKGALSLGPIERAELIDALFRSFDKGRGHRVDPLWAQEAESRIDAAAAGKIAADSAKAVLRRINKR